VTKAVVFSYQTITQRLPPFGTTTNVELLSLTDFIFSWNVPTPMNEKMIQISPLAVAYT
jgi:hypothetical protein